MAGVTQSDAQPVVAAMTSPTQPATFVEVYGTSISNHNLLARRSLNVAGLHSFDIRTTRPDGKPWDFTIKSHRQEARRIIRRTNPDWVLGAPPCTSFSIWNTGMNYPKMDPQKVRRLIDEGLVHLRFCCSLYRQQMAKGKYFVHEHPASALSWKPVSYTHLTLPTICSV